MKKNLIPIVIVGIFFSVSCSIEEDHEITQPLGEYEFHATTEALPQTKTVLQENGDIYWSKSDQIDIFSGESRSVFTSTNNTAAAETTFKGSLEGFTWNEDNEYWAVYPSRESNTFNGTSVTLDLAGNQDGYFSDARFPSIAKTQDDNLYFLNICGGIRFKLTEQGVCKISFRGKKNETLAGRITVGLGGDGNPVISKVEDAKTEITIETGYNYAPNTWWYIVCLPTVLSEGYELVLTKDTGEVTIKESTKSVEIKRAIWGSLDHVDAGLNYQMPSNEIWYKALKAITYPSYDGFGANFVSSDFNVTKGILSFDGPVTTIPGWSCFCLRDSETWEDPSGYGLTGIISISFPNTVESIQGYAIVGLSGLLALEFPEGLKIMEEDAVLSCEALQTVSLPASLTSIESNFALCPSLKKITVNEGNTVFDSRDNCNSVIETSTNKLVLGCAGSSIPSSIESIGDLAFVYKGLTAISIPETVKSIGRESFAYNSELSTLEINNGVEIIGAGAFMNDTKLKNIEIPETVKRIEDSAFSGCTAIEEIFVQAVDPPVIGSMVFNNTNNCPIYVPGQSLKAYKAAEYWSSYSSRLRPKEQLLIVDLGLSVKWASCNIGASTPEELGDYYAWGETETKSEYSKETYNWYLGLDYTPTKYNTDSGWGAVDHKIVLDPTDDVAHVKWGDQWRMPTAEECNELITQCTWTWTNYNGVSGLLVTGKNGNSIFIRASGYKNGNSVYPIGAGSYGSFWTASLNSEIPYLAFISDFGSDHYMVINDAREVGRVVRPVYDDIVPVTSISVPASLNMMIGEEYTISAEISPANATYTNISWESSDKSVATVDANGKVEAVAAGTATITVYSADASVTATCSVTVYSRPEAVDLGLSVKWANCNVGASAPEVYGDYYAWGETEIKESCYWQTYLLSNGTDDSLTKYCPTNKTGYWGASGKPDNKLVLDLEDDVAHVKLGGSWRMPTKAECTELVNQCTWTNATLNGVDGKLVTSKTNGNSIFLPFAGWHGLTTLYEVGTGGYYWSSTLNTDYPYYAWVLLLGSSSERLYSDNMDRALGYFVRPVSTE